MIQASDDIFSRHKVELKMALIESHQHAMGVAGRRQPSGWRLMRRFQFRRLYCSESTLNLIPFFLLFSEIILFKTFLKYILLGINIRLPFCLKEVISTKMYLTQKCLTKVSLKY